MMGVEIQLPENALPKLRIRIPVDIRDSRQLPRNATTP